MSNKEYIERGALERFIENGLNEKDPQKHFGYDGVRILAEVHHMPAADVEPVNHAHWFITEYEFFTCSACGEACLNGADSTAQAQSYLNSGYHYKRCPYCGAHMDEHATE